MEHKIFVSYHHANDQAKADYLRTEYDENNTLLDRSLDEAYEYMERVIEKMLSMSLSKELYERKEKFDLSEISYIKQLVEEMMENENKSDFQKED